VFARGAGSQARNRRNLVSARIVGLGVSALGVTTALSGCSIGRTFNGFGWPQNGITAQSREMHDIWIGSVVAALIVGFLVWGLIVWCIIRYRKRGDEMPLQTRFNLPIEILYTVLPFLVIAVLFYYTAVTETFVNKLTPNPDVKVETVAFKWNWEFRYLDDNAKGPDGQPVSTVGASDYIPVLVVPTDKRIRFYEDSKDVIHSFWVPDLLFKRDVFPQPVTNQFEVTIQKEGSYVGRCAEFCGEFHSMMNFELRAVTADKYGQFIAARKQGLSTPEALKSIDEAPFASKTKPFETDPRARTAS